MHEFHVFDNNTEWNFIFFALLRRIISSFGSAIERNTTIKVSTVKCNILFLSEYFVNIF